MRFVITGGGTGGHLVIAEALLEALRTRGHEAVFIGSVSGQDRMWFEKDSGFAKSWFLETTGVVNRSGFAKAAALWRIFTAFLQSRRIMKEYGPDALISVGGFSAAAASFAALSMKIPLYIHEQNAVSGRLNRLLRPYAKAFFSSYDENSPVKGYPVSKILFETARVRSSIKTMIFLGGSQGARVINDFALELAPDLFRHGIDIIHQCGERDYERVKAEYERIGCSVELYGFTKELHSLLARSDFAVSRAGASTLWELCANGLVALFVPYPYAAGDHQYHNAKYLADMDLAWCKRESDLKKEDILSLLNSDLSKKSRGVMAICEDGAAESIIEIIERECGC
jgi:UDP-N-acetylglucosamine--N-acetylmuramyl-(pentapeptide) pyrophosphoryl-undecaprenol N-acetylglucosamine transferase